MPSQPSKASFHCILTLHFITSSTALFLDASGKPLGTPGQLADVDAAALTVTNP